MLENIRIEDVMFLDIETVPETLSFDHLNPGCRICGKRNPK